LRRSFKVIIPSSNRRQELDPRISVSKYNASDLRVCASSNKRILDADHRLIIIGGGPAGLSAAVYAARAEMNPLVISRDGGQLESSHIVDNYPGFENGVDTIEFIQKLTSQVITNTETILLSFPTRLHTHPHSPLRLKDSVLSF